MEPVSEKSRDKAARPVDEKRVKVSQMNEKQSLRGSIERRIRSLVEAFRPNVRPYLDPTECSAEEDKR